MKNIKPTVLLCSFTLFAVSCNKENSYEVCNQGEFCNDSISLQKVENYLSLNIGNRIDPKPLNTQLNINNKSVEYLILDENKLYIFDLYADSLINTIKISNCGKLNNYSGFSYLNKDSILIYNYRDKTLSIVNTSPHSIKTYNLHDKKKTISPEALSYSPILKDRNKVFLSGIPISKASRLYDSDYITMSVDLNSGKLHYGAHFSDEYSKGYFGGVYYNTIYHCMDDENRIIYSFPASNHIYRYDTNLSLIDSIYMGSRYTDCIRCSSEPTLKFMSSEDERVKYFASQDSYSSILYDPYRYIYYRIAEHTSDSSDKDPFPKPFSIIAMNKFGELISETPVIRDKYNTGNMHVIKDGLMIQKYSNDENLIQFDIFRIADKTHNNHEN